MERKHRWHRHATFARPDRAWHFVLCRDKRNPDAVITVVHPSWNGAPYAATFTAISEADVAPIFGADDFLSVLAAIGRAS